MGWLGIFSRERRTLFQARSLLDSGQFDDALDLLRDLDDPDIASLRHQVRRAAATAFLREALAACEAGDGKRMRQRLARARRYHTPVLEPLFQATERRIREHQVRVTAPEHWLTLLDAARELEAHLSVGDTSRGELFRSRRLIRQAQPAFGAPIHAEAVEGAGRDVLRAVQGAVRAEYPDELGERVPHLGEPFAQAVLFIALGRPDLAALPLLELPETEPLVSFERARVAHALGQSRLALTALQGFVTLVGGHRTIRRLNTGVFLAQMAEVVGEPERALAVLDELPVRIMGRRPVALYARLLLQVGRGSEARALLADHLERHPDHPEARALFERACAE